jgi:hypothetical protein
MNVQRFFTNASVPLVVCIVFIVIIVIVLVYKYKEGYSYSFGFPLDSFGTGIYGFANPYANIVPPFNGTATYTTPIYDPHSAGPYNWYNTNPMNVPQMYGNPFIYRDASVPYYWSNVAPYLSKPCYSSSENDGCVPGYYKVKGKKRKEDTSENSNWRCCRFGY